MHKKIKYKKLLKLSNRILIFLILVNSRSLALFFGVLFCSWTASKLFLVT